MAGTYEVKKTSGDKFMFNLKAANGQVILTSQQYATKDTAANGIESVKSHAADDANYQRKESSAGEPFFVLVAKNGQVIGTSQMYSSPAAMENAIGSVKENGPGAAVADLTAAG